MKRSMTLVLLGSLLCLTSPAKADDAAQQAGFSAGTSARHHAVSSRHSYARGSRVVAVTGGGPFYRLAPIPHKVFGDRRWPYVHWFGAADSLYAAGPLVTFVRYQYY